RGRVRRRAAGLHRAQGLGMAGPDRRAGLVKQARLHGASALRPAVHQALQVVGLCAVDQLQVGQAGVQQPAHTLDIARVDCGRQPADAAVGAKAVAHPQLGDGL
ncbi:hypothetical protein RZS08_49480, partial [Arthrospira platensis SPKY1]|nr:hypothetical protein [Arthrospira platensis SPKY1]